MTVAYRRDRRRLVQELQAGGVDDLAVLHAFDAVPRHLFVPEALWGRAYENTALPIGHGQTISRPAVQALHLTLAELQGDEKVLEVGTGSGYLTALLAHLTAEVFSVERIPRLATEARERLRELGYGRIRLRTGDGSRGWPEAAPFDVIFVAAAAPSVPAALREQLGRGGRLLVPVGRDDAQELRLVRRSSDGWSEERIEASRFVPLLGEQGW